MHFRKQSDFTIRRYSLKAEIQQLRRIKNLLKYHPDMTIDQIVDYVDEQIERKTAIKSEVNKLNEDFRKNLTNQTNHYIKSV